MRRCVVLGLAVGGAVLCALPTAWAQAPSGLGANPFAASPSKKTKEQPLSDRLPEKPSLTPVFTIPIEPIGFTVPGASYLGLRYSFASLDFLDENRLLFTFRVPGLLHREPGDSGEGDAHQIRAVVVALPEGKVEAEALWTVHDRGRYLWMLKDGHFLLRDRDTVQEGDAKLELKPLLQFPGSLLWLDLDPTQQFMVTNSVEPAVAAEAGADGLAVGKAAVGQAAAGQGPDHFDSRKTDLVVRILQRESGRVMLVSRAPATVHLPINADGYLESLRGMGQQWLLNLKFFSGGSRILGRVDSSCSPAFEFISQREVLVTACNGGGGRRLVAMDTDGNRLWEDSTAASAIWPLVVVGPDGSRLAQETLSINHAVNAYEPIDREDVKGQLVRVFNAADGKVALEAAASPALDSGGNLAISETGRRVALLNSGAIQVFDLPAAPTLADAGGNPTGH